MKFKSRILAVVALAAMCITGCGSSAASVDPAALADSLVTGIEYQDQLSKLDEADVSNYIDLVDNVSSIMYMGSGSTAEEVAVFTAQNEEDAATMKENVQSFLNDQKDSFKAYIPEAADMVDDAVLVQNGNYVVLVVSGDSAKAKELVDKAFN